MTGDENQILKLLLEHKREQTDQQRILEIAHDEIPVKQKISEIIKIDKQSHERIVKGKVSDFLKTSRDPRIRSNLSHIQNEVMYCLPGFQKDFSATYVLLIDDLTYITKTVSYMLEKAGFHVFSAKNGIDAIILFQKVLPDIIVTDIRLPDFNGFEIAALIRQIDEAIPIIFITAVDVDVNSFSAISGKKAFLQKPIKRDVLIETIEELRSEQVSV
ncbi:MAG: response regulator [Spirochaetales bacterium]|nr:response regulator [Spirochaetales bacterium]